MRFGEFNRNNGSQALSDVFAREFVVVFYEIEFLTRVVYEFRKRETESVDMRAALFGIYVVGERDHVFVITVVILHCDFDRNGVVIFAEIKHLTYRLFIGVQKFDVFGNTAFVQKFVFRFLPRPLVFENDFKTGVKKREIAENTLYGIIVKNRRFENFVIGFESNSRTRFGCIAYDEKPCARNTPVVFLTVVLSVLIYVYRSVFGKSVYGFKTYAVQTRRNRISAAAEFAARVGFRHNDFYRRNAFFFVYARGNTSSVIPYRTRTVFFDSYGNGIAVACESLVHGVVHYLFYEMVKPSFVRRGYIHAGAFSDVFESFENLYLVRAVTPFDFIFDIHFTLLSVESYNIVYIINYYKK